MQSWEIHLTDWARVLFGDVPPAFFIEVVFRVLFVYALVIVCIRLMGKRMAGQLSRNEMVAISSLAASIGIPIQAPDRGLLPALLVALIVVAAQLIVSARLSRHAAFEKHSQGNISILVEDGCLRLQEMQRVRVSRAELFARLRSMKVMHLGELKRLYFEAEGNFSLVNNREKKPGLSILPLEDPAFLSEQSYSLDYYVCQNCGKGKNSDDECCPNCRHDKYVKAQI
jgi:uncharacterized membrane protein YcaP (DUF421 family)